MLPTELHMCLEETYYWADHAGVGIDTVEAANFPALPVVMSLLLVGPLRFSVGISTCIPVLAGRGRTGAFLVLNL